MSRSELESSREFQRLVKEEDKQIAIITDYDQIYGPFPKGGFFNYKFQPCTLDILLYQIKCANSYRIDPLYILIRQDGQYQLIAVRPAPIWKFDPKFASSSS